ncbi:MAG TPA: M13 family metallopeptidase N-terminal domain-containing protein [Blastocatellia bacterium]|nr:M13 family metallopeptidase N-terminal domain-containing protein [Blastocatellia bacterium]
MFELMGEDSQKAAAGAKTVIAIETRLAGAQLSRIELRNPTSSYHMMTGAERKTLMPNFDWDAYLQDAGLRGVTSMNVAQPEFFKAFGCGDGDKMVRTKDRCQIW